MTKYEIVELLAALGEDTATKMEDETRDSAQILEDLMARLAEFCEELRPGSTEPFEKLNDFRRIDPLYPLRDIVVRPKEMEAPADSKPHAFEGGYSGMRCDHLFMSSGILGNNKEPAICGLPAAHSIHIRKK